MNNPFRTQIQMVRRGTPPDFEDALIEVSNRRFGRVIINYDRLLDLMEQANDGRHFIELANAEIRAAKRFGK
jgi:hypothetical protein